MLSSIYRAAPTGIAVLIHRKILEANDAVSKLSGYSREEIVGPKYKNNVLVILSSGYSREQDSVPELIREGLAGFIQKPYNFHAIHQQL